MIEALLILQPLLMALLGGILATLGGVFAVRQQAQLARRIRMDEYFAEKKVEANAQAFKKAKVIQAMLIQAGTEQVLKQMRADEEWLFEQRLFLPGKFPERWLATRGCVTEAAGLESNLKDADKPRVLALHEKARKSMDDALWEVYRDSNLEPMQIELLDTTVSELRG